MDELLSRGQSKSLLYKRLLSWKKAPRDGSGAADINMGKEALRQAFKARIYVKRAGRNFEPFRRDLYNGYVTGSREYPFDVIEANRQMEYYHPNY